MNEETLRLAARAVSLDVWFNHEKKSYGYGTPQNFTEWDPLRNDRDAFRLMVLLRFSVIYHWTLMIVEVHTGEERIVEAYGPESSQDAFTATRMAIVHAASKIGRYL